MNALCLFTLWALTCPTFNYTQKKEFLWVLETRDLPRRLGCGEMFSGDTPREILPRGVSPGGNDVSIARMHQMLPRYLILSRPHTSSCSVEGQSPCEETVSLHRFRFPTFTAREIKGPTGL